MKSSILHTQVNLLENLLRLNLNGLRFNYCSFEYVVGRGAGNTRFWSASDNAF